MLAVQIKFSNNSIGDGIGIRRVLRKAFVVCYVSTIIENINIYRNHIILVVLNKF